MQKIKNISIKIALIAPSFFLFSLTAFAADCAKDEEGNILNNPLCSDSFSQLFEKISILAVQIGIPIAALFIIYSGLRLVMARGNADTIKEAKEGLLWSVIGTAILIGAWAIIKVLQSTVKSL